MTALRSLLTGLVDYAGLFPPAGLPMPEAVRLYDAYRRGRSAWALGRFVVPVARLAEFSDAAAPVLPSGEGAVPWRLSALAGRDFASDLGQVLAFNARHGRAGDGCARVDAVEIRAATADAADLGTRLFDGFGVACEVEAPAAGLEVVLRAIKAGGGIAKLRTGGATEDAIPGVDGVSRFLWACARHDVAFKLTAGLHHPVRGEYALTYDDQSPRGVMHGLLNVLVAALAARRLAGAAGDSPMLLGGRRDAPPLIRSILADRDPAAFAFRAEGLTWRTVAFSTNDVESARAAFALSVGSCSFEEPLDELRALGYGV